MGAGDSPAPVARTKPRIGATPDGDASFSIPHSEPERRFPLFGWSSDPASPRIRFRPRPKLLQTRARHRQSGRTHSRQCPGPERTDSTQRGKNLGCPPGTGASHGWSLTALAHCINASLPSPTLLARSILSQSSPHWGRPLSVRPKTSRPRIASHQSAPALALLHIRAARPRPTP
jgi:hypothetical protein